MSNVEPSARVFVVDDDLSVRTGLCRLLASEGYAVEAFESAQAFLDQSAPLNGPACLVLEVFLPGFSGLELQRRRIETEAPPSIVFLTGQGDVQMSVKAMKGGAVEFLTKPFRPQEIVASVRVAIEREQTRHRERQALAELRVRFQSLTTREREVMAGVRAGLLNKQIAAQFGTTEMTVKEQRGQLTRKMAAASAAQLVRMAVALGVAPLLANSPQTG